MFNVFVEESAEKLHVRLSNGRMMSLKDLVMDYERLLEESSKKEVTSKPKEDVPTASKLEVGKWFRIDRELINRRKEEIWRKCNEAGTKGRILWQKFGEANKIANSNPDRYTRLIETYIFAHEWSEPISEQRMRDMCQNLGDGMCDEIICFLELQMRIVGGESVDDLLNKNDKLPCVRMIQLRNGGTAYFGGGIDYHNFIPPAEFFKCNFEPYHKSWKTTPYAFRRVLS